VACLRPWGLTPNIRYQTIQARHAQVAAASGITVEPVTGNPDMRHVSTSYVERSTLTLRMGCRRFTRLTNAFSKKVENHAHAVALHMLFYNFCRIHKTLRITPAMAANVTDKLMSMDDVVTLIDAGAREARPLQEAGSGLTVLTPPP
jgi:hypothetical protein